MRKSVAQKNTFLSTKTDAAFLQNTEQTVTAVLRCNKTGALVVMRRCRVARLDRDEYGVVRIVLAEDIDLPTSPPPAMLRYYTPIAADWRDKAPTVDERLVHLHVFLRDGELHQNIGVGVFVDAKPTTRPPRAWHALIAGDMDRLKRVEKRTAPNALLSGS